MIVSGVRAAVTNVTPTEITAIAPPANGAKGTVLLTVSDPLTLGITAIQDGLSYDAMGGDAVFRIVTAPYGSVSSGTLLPFTVRALAADGQTPAAVVNVTFTVTEGAATLSCGKRQAAAPLQEQMVQLPSVSRPTLLRLRRSPLRSAMPPAFFPSAPGVLRHPSFR